MDGSTTDVPGSEKNAAFFGPPLERPRLSACPHVSGSRSNRARGRPPAGHGGRHVRHWAAGSWPWTCCAASALGCARSRTGTSVLVPGPSYPRRRGARPVAGIGELRPAVGDGSADGTYQAELRSPRGKDGPVAALRVTKYAVRTAAEGCTGSPRRYAARSRTCSTPRSIRHWAWRAATRTGEAARPS
jgi:hypothetical protein